VTYLTEALPIDKTRGQIEIVVKVTRDAAIPGTSASRGVHSCAAALGISLKPLHPNSSDPELTSYYSAQIADPTVIANITEQLRNCDGVEGAYAKPTGEVPFGVQQISGR
jgi:hypothetical protein